MPSNGKNRALRRLRAGSWRLRHRLKRADVRGQFNLGQLTLWPIALAIGIVTGYAVILFRIGISGLETLVYGASDEIIHSVAAALPWYLVLSAPILGGLVVGLILTISTRARPGLDPGRPRPRGRRGDRGGGDPGWPG